jgi:hypothetical protein
MPMPGDILEEFLAPYSPEVKNLGVQARRLIVHTIPVLIEDADPSSKIIAYRLICLSHKENKCPLST